VQQYSALKKQENADVVAIVTTSSFTDPAISLAQELDIRLVNGDDLAEMVRENQATEVLQDHASQTRGDVASPTEFAGDTVTRLRLTRGVSYLAALAVGIAVLYAGLFMESQLGNTLMWIGWGVVPITAYVYSKAVPEATFSKQILVALILVPMFAGPYYLYQEF
jgi:hypothetical protein